MVARIKQSRFAIPVYLLAGALLFATVLYPVLSSAQSDMGNDRRDAARERVAEITDERKARIAERLTNQMETVNDLLSAKSLRYLERLETILEKVSTRLAEVEAGTGKADVQAKIEAATNAITVAKSATVTQQNKVYDIDFDSEDKLRDGFQSTKEQMKADHNALREQIKSAKQAVQDAFEALRELVNE